jgi:hypothetical protein
VKSLRLLQRMVKKIIILITFISCTPLHGFSQSCSIPQPLTSAQMEMINGVWTGYYSLNGKLTEFTVKIKCSNGSVQCTISNPPLTGEIQSEVYRFCGAGAFHFRKETNDAFYEFDGVPANEEMIGTLSTDAEEKKVFGKFYLKKEKGSL